MIDLRFLQERRWSWMVFERVLLVGSGPWGEEHPFSFLVRYYSYVLLCLMFSCTTARMSHLSSLHCSHLLASCLPKRATLLPSPRFFPFEYLMLWIVVRFLVYSSVFCCWLVNWDVCGWNQTLMRAGWFCMLCCCFELFGFVLHIKIIILRLFLSIE